MGGNVSRVEETSTVIAYTLYGFGCRCTSTSEGFVRGAPRDGGCGTVACSGHEFTPPMRFAEVLAAFEADLPRATAVAETSIDKCTHLWCAQCDTSADSVAAALNSGFCRDWNQGGLGREGLQCEARSEIFGFGRSRVTYVVIRIRLTAGQPQQGYQESYSYQ
jgi:hypothetical protein